MSKENLRNVDSFFQEQLEKNKKYVEDFCKKKKVILVERDVTMENMITEPIYTFSDNLGGYTIEGIKASLQ